MKVSPTDSQSKGVFTECPVVGYLGPAGTYTEEAAEVYFRTGFNPQLFFSLDDVFDAVESGGVDFGVVAIENTTEGAVPRTLDLLSTTSLKIYGELSLPIQHHLLTSTGSIEGLVRVRAHAHALAQCHHWLTENTPLLVREAVLSNAEAARMAMTDPTSAAIASAGSARQYGLKISCSAIQDDPLNRTRFLILHKKDSDYTENAKTSLIVSVKNEVGALQSIVEPFTRHGVSMARFESRPAKTGAWEYNFYVDLIGHRKDANVAQALTDLSSYATVRMLGSYRRE